MCVQEYYATEEFLEKINTFFGELYVFRYEFNRVMFDVFLRIEM